MAAGGGTGGGGAFTAGCWFAIDEERGVDVAETKGVMSGEER